MKQKSLFLIETDFGSFVQFDSKWSNVSDACIRVREIINNLQDSMDWQLVISDEQEMIWSNDLDFIRVATCPKEFFNEA